MGRRWGVPLMPGQLPPSLPQVGWDEPWERGPPKTAHMVLPSDVVDRLVPRARAAGCFNQDGKPCLFKLLNWTWRQIGGGDITNRVLDAVAADASDPDMQALQRAAVQGSMERVRPN